MTGSATREWKLFAGAILAVFGVAVVLLFQALFIKQIQTRIGSARDRYRAADRLLALLTKAETGQRGLLLTGSEAYLKPYNSVIAEIPDAISTFVSLQPSAASEKIASQARAKLDELAETIRLFRAGDSAGAMQVVRTGLGNSLMALLQSEVGQIADQHHAIASEATKQVLRLDELLTLFSLVALISISFVLLLLMERLRNTFSLNRSLTIGLEEGKEEYRLLAQRLEDIREAERTQLARELHDELGQSLTGIKLELGGANLAFANGNGEKVNQKISRAVASTDEAIRSVRRIATQLRPPQLDHVGLEGAIEAYADQFSKRTGVDITMSLPGLKLPLTETQNVALFRIVQESLTNVTRHAQAKSVEIKATVDDGELKLEIKDDGVGILPTNGISRSLGLLGMKERTKSIGGQLELHSIPGTGTTVQIRLPLSSQSKAVAG